MDNRNLMESTQSQSSLMSCHTKAETKQNKKKKHAASVSH